MVFQEDALFFLLSSFFYFCIHLYICIYVYMYTYFQNHRYCPPLSCSGNLRGLLPCRMRRLHPVDLFFSVVFISLMGFFLFISVYIVHFIVHIVVALLKHIDFIFLNYNTFYIFLLLIILSGDVEVNPGPLNMMHRHCRMLYCNIRGLHGNLPDLIVASKQ